MSLQNTLAITVYVTALNWQTYGVCMEYTFGVTGLTWVYLSDTRMRFRLMLSSMSASVTKWLLGISRKLLDIRKWRHKLLPIGSKSYKRVHFGSCSGRDFSLTVQPILKRFTVLESVIQALYFFLCKLLDIFATWPRKWGSDGPTVVYPYPLHKWLILICSEIAKASSFKI